MEFTWFESILYGIVSGFIEFLPISSEAHQQLMLKLFGVNSVDPVRNIFVHIAALAAIYINLRSFFEHVRRERNSRQHKKHRASSRLQFDYKFLRGAAIPMLIVYFIVRLIAKPDNNLLMCSIFSLFNGLILFVADRIVQGNKDSRLMSAGDSLLVGAAAGLSALPGLSRVGCAAVAASARGAERKYCSNWALMLSVPALFGTVVMDIVLAFAGEAYPFWPNLLSYIISAICTYLGCYFGIRLLKYVSVKKGFSTFAYYSLGLAILLFILFLVVV